MGFEDFAAGGGPGYVSAASNMAAGAGAVVAGAVGTWWHNRQRKSTQAQKQQAARAAKRTADKDVKRRRIPGDPQLGQRAEYSLTNATSFKRPASISLGKSEHQPVLMDWLKSLVQSSKFNVQFACDWKSAPNTRKISWHCYRHNMSSWRRRNGLASGTNINSLNNQISLTSSAIATAGYTVNADWTQWMLPAQPAGTDTDWISEGDGVYELPYFNCMLRPDNLTVVTGGNVQNATTNGNNNGGYTASQSITTPFIDQLHNRVYYAPINLSDIEDECYRNNRIYPQNQTSDLFSPAMAPGQNLLSHSHRCMSRLAQQNINIVTDVSAAPYVTITPPSVPGTPAEQAAAIASRNQYKCLIEKGNVNYKFINKADGPCKVEIIVWKFKSTHVSPPCYNRVDPGQSAPGEYAATDSRYYMQFGDGPITVPATNLPIAGDPSPVCNAIQTTLDRYSEAYFRACTNKYGSDTMSGRVPLATDVFDDPHFPLLKKHSKYFQDSLCDFSEHSRYTYTLESGQRQEVNIKLPGEHYNPLSVGKDFDLNESQTSSTLPGQTISTAWGVPGFGSEYGTNPVNPYNKFTYFVMVATSGCNMAAAYVKAPDGNQYGPAGNLPVGKGPDNIDVGTAYSASHVQAYCTYSENIGAMATKMGKRNLYNLGGLGEPVRSDPSAVGTDKKPVNVYNLDIGPRIPLDRVVRLPPQHSTSSIYYGNTDATGQTASTKTTTRSANTTETFDYAEGN